MDLVQRSQNLHELHKADMSKVKLELSVAKRGKQGKTKSRCPHHTKRKSSDGFVVKRGLEWATA